jgi:AraC-like DNA-binding protein
LVWIFARVNASGSEAQQILARENIGPAEYFNPETRIPHRIAMELLRSSVDGGDPEIGLRAGASLQPGDFAVLEYAARSCSTLREAMGCFARYVSLLNEAAEQTLVEQRDRAIWRQYVTDGVPQLPAANDFILASADAFAKTYCEIYEPPLEVHFAHPEPRYRATYASVFGTKVRFGAACNAFVLPRARLEVPLRRKDSAARAQYETYAQEWLVRNRQSSSTAVQVRRVLLHNLHTGAGSMAVTARKLAMSVATLRRRLEDEGATFAEVLDTLRYDLAKKYLLDPGVIASDVAFLLGFRHTSSFLKAFRRWSGGVSTVEFRQNHLQTKTQGAG